MDNMVHNLEMNIGTGIFLVGFIMIASVLSLVILGILRDRFDKFRNFWFPTLVIGSVMLILGMTLEGLD